MIKCKYAKKHFELPKEHYNAYPFNTTLICANHKKTGVIHINKEKCEKCIYKKNK